jgi:FkbM family methyltransferase
VIATLWLLARDKTGWLPPPPMQLRTTRHGRTVRFRVGDYQDLEVMRELYVDGEYDVPLPTRADVVLDLGANVGLAALDFRARYPEASIYAIEPDPLAFAKLERNVRGDAGIHTLNIAVAREGGEREFFTSRESVVSAFERTRDFQDAIQVRTCSVDAIVAALGLDVIDVLKLDVEGAEGEALAGFSGLSGVRCVVGEVHLDMLGTSPEAFYATHLEGFEVSTHLREPQRCTFTAVPR